MEPSFFTGASDVRVAGDVTSETIGGDYIDEGRTTIKEKRVGREVYHQGGSVGVLNGNAKFTGTLNYGRPVRGIPSRLAWRKERGSEEGHFPSPECPPSRRSPPITAPSSFQDAESVSVCGVSSRTVNGSMYARGTEKITREDVPLREYRQEGSVGVVNGNAEFGGVLNYGGSTGRWESTNTRRQTPYPDSDSDGTNSEVNCWGRYRDQRGAVGVINDHGTFSGNLNYSPLPTTFHTNQQQKHHGDYYYNCLPDGRDQPTRPEPWSNAPHEQYGTPTVDVGSSPGDVFEMYDKNRSSSMSTQYGSRYVDPSGFEPPRRGEWACRGHGYAQGQRFPPRPPPRAAAASPHLGDRQYRPTPHSPCSHPTHPSHSQRFAGDRKQWGSGGMARGSNGTPTGLTPHMANMRLHTQQWAAYQSPPSVGCGPNPPEKGQYVYN